EAGALYLGVAAMRVEQVHASHQEAASTFLPAIYVAAARPTRYPPNLAHANYPGQCVARSACITHDHERIGHTPTSSTARMHQTQYEFYKTRATAQPVAECRFAESDGRFALALDPATAPLLSCRDWGGGR